MNIYFVRHGEGIDDVYDEFGGWSDRELSPKGVNLAFDMSKKIKDIETDIGQFSIVYTSPLRRCSETAEIIGNELALRVRDLPYLKERNTYGLLSGVKKDVAKKDYPNLLERFKAGKYIPSAERYKDFVERVGILLDHLKDEKYKNLLCVTHGHLITVIAEEFGGLIRDRITDGCILGTEVDENGKIKITESSGITFTKNKEKLNCRNKFKSF